jgi:sugar phosphate isomerase/epimerase
MSSQRSLSRRAFLALAGTLPLAERLAASMSSAPASAAASKIPVGLELYTVRAALATDLMGTVRAVAKLGYEVVEFYSPYYDWTPQMATDVRKLLDDLGIRCLSTHNAATTFSPDGLQKAIDLNQTIGSHYIVMASSGKEPTTIDGWKGIAERLDAAAEKLAPLGMATGYHNHASEWRPVEGTRPMEVLAANTGKGVMLQLDLGTCVEAGSDPVAWIKANPGRIKSLHCKEWKRGGTGYAALFGEGDVPWKAVFEAAESVGGVEYYLIEQEEGPKEEQLHRAEQCLANWKKLRA